MENLKLGFIAECLRNYAQNVKQAMAREITRQKAIESGALLKSISYRIYQQNADGNTAISFAEWGRFLDMGVGKGNPLGSPAKTLDIVEARRRKPKKIYSPIAYGHLNQLMGDLSHGFTEETIARLKSELQNQAQQ